MHHITSYRKKNKLSRVELAKVLGCTPAMIGHVEHGRRGVLWQNAIAWEKATNGGLQREKLLPQLFKGFQRVA